MFWQSSCLLIEVFLNLISLFFINLRQVSSHQSTYKDVSLPGETSVFKSSRNWLYPLESNSGTSSANFQRCPCLAAFLHACALGPLLKDAAVLYKRCTSACLWRWCLLVVPWAQRTSPSSRAAQHSGKLHFLSRKYIYVLPRSEDLGPFQDVASQQLHLSRRYAFRLGKWFHPFIPFTACVDVQKDFISFFISVYPASHSILCLKGNKPVVTSFLPVFCKRRTRGFKRYLNSALVCQLCRFRLCANSQFPLARCFLTSQVIRLCRHTEPSSARLCVYARLHVTLHGHTICVPFSCHPERGEIFLARWGFRFVQG